MKVLQLVEAAAAGVGRHVMDLTDGLLARGHEVHLLYSPLRSDQAFADDLRRLGVSAGFHSVPVPMRRELSADDLSAVRVFRQYARCHGPFDLLHCHSTKAGLLGRLGGFGYSIRRIVYTPGGFFAMDPTRPRWARGVAAMLESALSALGDRVVVVSRQEHSHAMEQGIAPSRLSLIPHGVSLDGPRLSATARAALRRDWGVRDDEVCLGFVGRLVPVKSPETLVGAFATTIHRARARLVIMGDGPLAEPLRRLSAGLGVETSVVWLGERDARPLMEAFDVLVVTSDSEAGPLVVLEAMARGLPVVATSVGGISETVQPGVNGFVVPVRGVSEIAAALDLLISDPALRERMGHASRALARNFSVDRMVERTIDLYYDVLSDASMRHPSSQPASLH